MGHSHHHRNYSNQFERHGARERELVLDHVNKDGSAVRTDARMAHCHHFLHGGDLCICMVVYASPLPQPGEHGRQ